MIGLGSHHQPVEGYDGCSTELAKRSHSSISPRVRACKKGPPARVAEDESYNLLTEKQEPREDIVDGHEMKTWTPEAMEQ